MEENVRAWRRSHNVKEGRGPRFRNARQRWVAASNRRAACVLDAPGQKQGVLAARGIARCRPTSALLENAQTGELATSSFGLSARNVDVSAASEDETIDRADEDRSRPPGRSGGV